MEIPAAGLDSVRRDVDTGEDLRVALELGVGRWTAALRPAPAAAAEVRDRSAPDGP